MYNNVTTKTKNKIYKEWEKLLFKKSKFSF